LRRAAGRFGDSPRRTNQSREVAGGRRRRGRCGFVAWGEPVTGDFKIAARGTDRDRAGAYEFTRLKDGLIDAERHGQTRRALAPPVRSLLARIALMLDTDPFAVGREPRAIGDLQRGLPAQLVVPTVVDAMDRQPLWRFWRQNWQGSGGRAIFTSRAGNSYPQSGHSVAESATMLSHMGPDLCGCLAPATLARAFGPDQINRPMAANITREIQNKAVSLPGASLVPRPTI